MLGKILINFAFQICKVYTDKTIPPTLPSLHWITWLINWPKNYTVKSLNNLVGYVIPFNRKVLSLSVHSSILTE